MFERMTTQHGYSLRKLAQKLGKDKGYIENRLRLADAPPEVRRARVVAQRHAVRRLRAAEGRATRASGAGWPSQVATGELSLVKLRERIEGRPPRPEAGGSDESADVTGAGPRRSRPEPVTVAVEAVAAEAAAMPAARGCDRGWTSTRPPSTSSQAVNELTAALRADAALG